MVAFKNIARDPQRWGSQNITDTRIILNSCLKMPNNLGANYEF